jgi:UDP-glucose 4-epimerase
MKKTILVTGGAGYIGSAAVKSLILEGYSVIVVDNLSKGLLNLVDKKAKFYEVDLVDKKELQSVFKENKIDAVMHFAAYKSVEESMQNPAKYSDNIIGTINLLNCMVEYKVNKIIYSSSAAVYGSPKYNPIDEQHPTNPINFYGFTKLQCEQIIDEYSKLHGLKYISLRYFNVAGDAGLNYIDPHALNVLPILMEVVFGKRKIFTIFGEDYNTRDGTCIRDFIDINDLVKAHVLALNVNENGIINLGTSKGISVKELIEKTIQVTGKNFNYESKRRRKGDPPILVASNKKALRLLGWKSTKSINEMIKSTYEAYKIKRGK